MNHFAIGQNGFSTREEIRGSVPLSDRPVFCPKPRRPGFLNNDQPVRSLRWHLGHQSELYDSKPPTDLLDIIHPKVGCGGLEQLSSSNQVVASSPPFFCGSPPSRVANPLIQDARFGDERLFSPRSPLSPVPPPSSSGGFSSSPSSPNSAGRKGGGFVRANFGNNPAVRIEGFDCLDRDRRNCSIPALA